mmetsp:Transcript_8082/g.12027  ORF Transcript_8082/g.12027 Transcript_8082/m.12027 type:complete len:118 (+) Transcript_8082:2856-3209(+)
MAKMLPHNESPFFPHSRNIPMKKETRTITNVKERNPMNIQITKLVVSSLTKDIIQKIVTPGRIKKKDIKHPIEILQHETLKRLKLFEFLSMHRSYVQSKKEMKVYHENSKSNNPPRT